MLYIILSFSWVLSSLCHHSMSKLTVTPLILSEALQSESNVSIATNQSRDWTLGSYHLSSFQLFRQIIFTGFTVLQSLTSHYKLTLEIFSTTKDTLYHP